MHLEYLQFAGLLTLLLIVPGLAVRCYECNSSIDKECLTIDSRANKFLKDCSQASKTNPAINYTLCRKVDMYMDTEFGKEHPAENRVHRACGYLEDQESNHCYYKSGYNTRSWVCSCHSDDCNSVSNLKPPVALLIAIIAAILYTST